MMENCLNESMITCRNPLRMHVLIHGYGFPSKHRSRTSIDYTEKHIKNNEWNTVKHAFLDELWSLVNKNLNTPANVEFQTVSYTLTKTPRLGPFLLDFSYVSSTEEKHTRNTRSCNDMPDINIRMIYIY